YPVDAPHTFAVVASRRRDEVNSLESVICEARLTDAVDGLVGILPPLRSDDGNGRIGGVAVEIPGQDLRKVVRIERRLLAKCARLALPCSLAQVVEVGVDQAEVQAGLTVFDPNPVGKADVGTVPRAGLRDVRRQRKPESSARNQFKSIPPVEDCVE